MKANWMKSLQTESAISFPDLPPSIDRRQRERIALHIPVRILSYGLLMDKADEGICTDLSEGGVAFDTSAVLNVGDVITLEFRQKGESSYRCHARLSYRAGRKYGAYFLHGE
jgi:hypothetical protein